MKIGSDNSVVISLLWNLLIVGMRKITPCFVFITEIGDERK